MVLNYEAYQMEKSIKILFAMFAVLVLSGIAYAANEKDEVLTTTIATTEAAPVEQPAAKNMTYGQCVSENAAIKNSCYAAVKDTVKTCKNNVAQNATKKDRKDSSKQCKQTYAKEKKQCKATFKASKNECKKIKHNFLETIGSSMK